MTWTVENTCLAADCAAPRVIPTPAGTAELLADCDDYAIVFSCSTRVAWQRIDGWWWQPGSEVPLDNLDLAAQGPFIVISDGMVAA